ncbi:MAG: M48 family metallopeptidase [Halomonadaceae bacterium]|uniref:M48 family metallopeptidase n=1 Tax=Halomonas colorata TaxID=2742615 RepID=A0ABR9FYM2_9GAMM|nr:M48 family metallopeptidase [Halomonas colorata]MBE0463722.1 M48 family metallopeptidase [Halomonas colorata]
MDFFTAQDHARRKTGQLVVLLIAAVIALIAVTTVVIAIVIHFMRDDRGSVTADSLLAALSPELVAVVALGVVAFVSIGGLFKRSQLRRGGGKVVAEALGGREINPNTENANERRILNVVEEMAIASGMPVPSVYLLQETGINAFAAGFDTSDAVIGITQGAINHLSREELQGVVAHEFSHILHGDMRLISVLHGVLLIGLLGYILLRSTTSRGRSVRRNNQNNKGAVVVLALGVALAVIGYAGTFFGNWIKAAVSRQREYLADASAVQYTRNPNGIGQALIKIGSHAQGARIEASQASEYSHLFFGQGMKLGFTRLLATHPPIRQRITRVLPHWNGEFNASFSAPAVSDVANAGDQSAVGFADIPSAHSSAATMTGASAQAAIASMGQPGPRHLANAKATLDALPARIRRASQDPYAVRALMYALLLSQHIEVRKQQLASLQQVALPDVYREVMSHAGEVLMLRDPLRLPLMELALPALKNLSVDQATHFRQCMVELINADSQVSLFEWTLYHWLVHHMGLGKKDSGPAVRKLSDLQPECQLLLNVLARAGQSDPDKVNAALDAAEKELPFALSAKSEVPDIKSLGPAVSRLRRLRPQQKPAVLQAMARCIEHSGLIKPAEAELFRVIADMLECPMPPLLIEG